MNENLDLRRKKFEFVSYNTLKKYVSKTISAGHVLCENNAIYLRTMYTPLLTRPDSELKLKNK